MNRGAKIAIGIVIMLIACPLLGFGIWALLVKTMPQTFPVFSSKDDKTNKSKNAIIALWSLTLGIPILFAAIYFGIVLTSSSQMPKTSSQTQQ